ncbi:hypothetical protein FOMPIDRAFT_1053283 [Fomitopsis schrenkii]|uniref:C2H2-type domain-containing protein n=1 Tax=Fomitopsis schrenkii TaxID=2126942 RepID=S8DZC3_FOMSC|nr:hypothetical protein FOMPIDRAFT_1053283 [Fomitopsis schrenkii]
MLPYNRQHGNPEAEHSATHARCIWDGGICGITLDDLSPSGVIRHLKAYHFNHPANPWENKKRGVCRWGCEECGSGEMNYESLGKHIASVHLRSTARPCTVCGRQFARTDTLSRHLLENCPGA